MQKISTVDLESIFVCLRYVLSGFYFGLRVYIFCLNPQKTFDIFTDFFSKVIYYLAQWVDFTIIDNWIWKTVINFNTFSHSCWTAPHYVFKLKTTLQVWVVLYFDKNQIWQKTIQTSLVVIGHKSFIVVKHVEKFKFD